MITRQTLSAGRLTNAPKFPAAVVVSADQCNVLQRSTGQCAARHLCTCHARKALETIFGESGRALPGAYGHTTKHHLTPVSNLIGQQAFCYSL